MDDMHDDGFSPDEWSGLKVHYRRALLDDTMHFWFPRAVDEEYGGYLTFRGRDGTLVDDDKSVWQQGRFSWLLSTLYHTVDKKEEWLVAAKSGLDFLQNFCFDRSGDGRMFFHVTRSGQPIRKRRYFFSECFAAMAFASYARASGDAEAAREARNLFQQCLDYYRNPQLLPAKFTATRPSRALGPAMILINVAQILRECLSDNLCSIVIDELIADIRKYFFKPEYECLLEISDLEGGVIDHFDGRTLNPGHAIECAWFLLHEAKVRGDQSLMEMGCQILDWMWNRGWDEKYGGLLYYVDLHGGAVQEYWHDMKFWWPHAEAEIACLLAWKMTGQSRYAGMYRQLRQFIAKSFEDNEFGEWFGYVHRDGRLSNSLKGNLWKGPFHIPRMQWYCLQLVSEDV